MNKETEEEIIHTNYPAELCSRRQWNEKKKCWERFFTNCSICSFMCAGRAGDFEKLGKKEYFDEETGMYYWK